MAQELEKIVSDMRECTEKLVAVIFVGTNNFRVRPIHLAHHTWQLQPQQRSSNLSNVVSASMFANPTVINKSITPLVSVDKFTSYPVYETVIDSPEKTTQKVATKLSAIPGWLYLTFQKLVLTICPVENVIVERKTSKKTYKEIQQFQKPSSAISEPKKRKCKVPKNEIDDIFGF